MSRMSAARVCIARRTMRRRHAIALTLAVVLTAAFGIELVRPTASQASTLPPGFADAVALTGLNTPTAVRFAPNGQVFVAEKGGVLKMYPSINNPVATIVADLSTEVYSWVAHGLLGLAVDPQYPVRPYVYVLYSLDAPAGGTPPVWHDNCPTASTGCLAAGRLSKLTIGPDGKMVSEQVLIEDWCQTCYYGISSVPNGTYTLTATKSGNSFAPPTDTATVSGSPSAGNDFLALSGVTISGRVTIGSASGPGDPGVTITRSGGGQPNATAKTNAAGYYGFSSVPATAGGTTYSIQPSKTGQSFTPPGAFVVVKTTQNATADFFQN